MLLLSSFHQEIGESVMCQSVCLVLYCGSCKFNRAINCRCQTGLWNSLWFVDEKNQLSSPALCKTFGFWTEGTVVWRQSGIMDMLHGRQQNNEGFLSGPDVSSLLLIELQGT